MKKKQSKADFLRSWGITDEVKLRAGFTWLRYKNPPEKGIYWYYFSLYVRQRDVEKYGVCISCGREITVDTCDAGHFMPTDDCGRDLIFHEQNVNAECSRCNAWDSTHLLGYAEGLDKRYGTGTAMLLRTLRQNYLDLDKPLKDFKGHEYAEKIRALPSYQQATIPNAVQ